MLEIRCGPGASLLWALISLSGSCLCFTILPVSWAFVSFGGGCSHSPGGGQSGTQTSRSRSLSAPYPRPPAPAVHLPQAKGRKDPGP